MKTPDFVSVREVDLRDGLQILPRVLPTAQQLDWIRAAHAAGASGNLATEDLADLSASMRVPTGLDFKTLA